MKLELRTKQVSVQDPTEDEGVRFRGVAITPGTYTTQAGLDVEITEDDLDRIAARLAEGVQIRDLHEERIEATVGAVEDAFLAGSEVRFDGRVAVEPHATVVRAFPETIRFSLGFRLDAEEIEDELGMTIQDAVSEGISARLPASFSIDHVAIVGQGQDPNARLERLLNRAKKQRDRTETQESNTSMEHEELISELKAQRDQALEARDQAHQELSQLQSRAEQLKADLDEARSEREDALELLNQAKGHFADEVLKLELKTGEDPNLTERREELLELGFGELDELRLDLATTLLEEQHEDEGPASKRDPTTPSDEEGEVLDLEALDLEDTVKLGLAKGAL